MKTAQAMIVVAVAALGLAACQPEPAAPARTAEAVPPPAPPAPPEPPPPPYVGLWAARADLCPSGAWVFDRNNVVTAGEVACEFREVAETSTGFQVIANCAVDGENRPYQFNLTLTDPAPPRAMTVSRGPWNGPITLLKCPA